MPSKAILHTVNLYLSTSGEGNIKKKNSITFQTVFLTVGYLSEWTASQELSNSSLVSFIIFFLQGGLKGSKSKSAIANQSTSCIFI